ncbi:hypothetical protein [Gordonia malaquae]|uniref:Rv0361 family membrane protein n=1 Tax=Gordonia malaquae TaxID=410332 RepID=UPI003016E4F5
MDQLKVNSGLVGSTLIAVAVIAGCAGPDQPSNELPQSASGSPASAAADIEEVSRAAINDYNTGDLAHLKAISCGQLQSELAPVDTTSFAAEAASDRSKRGNGQVVAVDHIKELKEFATANLQLQYEKPAAGLDMNRRVSLSATFQRVNGAWKICGMHA